MILRKVVISPGLAQDQEEFAEFWVAQNLGVEATRVAKGTCERGIKTQVVFLCDPSVRTVEGNKSERGGM